MAQVPQDFEEKKPSSDYFKPQDGMNKVVVIGDIIHGQVYWVTDAEGKQKPKRVQKGVEIPMSAIEKEGDPKLFWAMPVYNFDLKKIQIWEITQSGIRTDLTKIASNKKWGDMETWIITIEKTGEKLETRYSVVPEVLSEEEKAEINEAKKQMKPMNLNLLFISKENPFGGNPWEAKEEQGVGKDFDEWANAQ